MPPMKPPYLYLVTALVVAATAGAIAEASRSPAAAPPTAVSGETVTTLCIFSMTGAKIEINCAKDDVRAHIEDGLR